jgi:hypothetical protein
MTRALRARAGETGGDPVEDPVVGTWFATGWTYALLAVPVLLLPAALAHGGDPALRWPRPCSPAPCHLRARSARRTARDPPSA